MDFTNIEFTLPTAPVGLCFDKNDFVKTNFSVDHFLAEHQNVASLETMRDDLGAYLKVLRLAMIDLINKDYANFVNLSATLIGFEKAISKIQVPLEHLNEEVVGVKYCLEDAMKELSLWLSQRHALQKKKQLVKHYNQSLNCLNTLLAILSDISDKKLEEQIALADRAAMQYNHLKFSISKCDSLMKPDHKMQYNEVGGKLVLTLNDLLFKFWKSSDEKDLLKTLITLASLDRVKETEMLIRKQLVAPLLVDVINEPALQRSKDGLEGVYNRILCLLESELKVLLSVTQHSKLNFLVKKYRFIVNCFWCEVESRLEVNLSSIIAPGNPTIFYNRYSESMKFVRTLEMHCIDKENVKLLHETAEYKSFLRRWNLPVYFQIRFQEIAGKFEGSLSKLPTVEPKEGFELKETYMCWAALLECWSDGVYIEALAHKFWKLSLQLLARYSTWTGALCSQRLTIKSETININRSLVQNSINIYVDTQTLVQRLPQLLHIVESKITETEIKELLHKSIQPTEKILNLSKNKIKESIVNEMFEFFNNQLKQVSDIPRLYRKTNRSIPNKPCTYIEVITKEVLAFNTDVLKRLDNAFVVQLFESLFNVMTVAYYKYVEDVLTSVQKTEDSLRRLKQIREVNSTQVDNVGVTDGDKIRLQLNVDVVAYGRLADSVQVDVNNVAKYNVLSSMVTEAVKNIDIK